MARMPTDREIRKALDERLTVPLWPYAGRALGMQRGATYEAAKTGAIETLDVCRKKDVSTAWLKDKLKIKPA
jgi:hypothetical protein